MILLMLLLFMEEGVRSNNSKLDLKVEEIGCKKGKAISRLTNY